MWAWPSPKIGLVRIKQTKSFRLPTIKSIGAIAKTPKNVDHFKNNLSPGFFNLMSYVSKPFLELFGFILLTEPRLKELVIKSFRRFLLQQRIVCGAKLQILKQRHPMFLLRILKFGKHV